MSFPMMMQPVCQPATFPAATHTVGLFIAPDWQDARWEEHVKFLGEEEDMLEKVWNKKVTLVGDESSVCESMDMEMDDFKQQVQTSITLQTELVVLEKVVDLEKKKMQEDRRALKKTTNKAKKNTAMCTLAIASASGWKPRECIAFGCTHAHVQCTKRHCNFAHCERMLAEGKRNEVDLTKTVDCKFGAACADPANCRFLHPGETRREVQLD